MKVSVPMSSLARPAALVSGLLLMGALAAMPTHAADYGSPATTTSSSPASLQLGAGSSASLGTFLVGPTGMTLYTLSSETSTGSVCTGACLASWPALTVAAGGSVSGPVGAAGTFSTFTRADDGATQVALNGHPLYYFAGDSAAGQTNGEGIAALGGVWHVATVASAAANTSPSPTASPTNTGSVPPTSTDGSGSRDGSGVIPALLLALFGAATTTVVAVAALTRRMGRA